MVTNLKGFPVIIKIDLHDRLKYLALKHHMSLQAITNLIIEDHIAEWESIPEPNL